MKIVDRMTRTSYSIYCRERNEQNDTNERQQNFHSSQFDEDSKNILWKNENILKQLNS
jgi:hypothetical protein